LKKCNKEIRFVACLLDPFPTGRIDIWSYMSSLDESCLIEALSRNKVAVRFERKLEMYDVLKQKNCDFLRLKVFYQNLNTKIEKDSFEFSRIKDKLSKNGVEFMLIKSDGSFPYESDNIDVLIKPDRLREVVRLLKNAGYSEIVGAREPHKFLFRKMHTLDELPLHIHTRVEWEGTQFIDSRDLWERSKFSNGDDGFSVPSPEDCILITAAHLFFENHEIKLDDLLKIDSKIRDYSVNWDYVFDHAQRLHWNDAFHLTMLKLNQVYNQLYGRSMLQKSTLSKMEEFDLEWSNLFQKVINPFSSGATPLKIPYTVAGLFFLYKVLGDSSLPLAERFERVGLVACDVFKRKTMSSEKRVLATIDA
jgi:hypothetical protein